MDYTIVRFKEIIKKISQSAINVLLIELSAFCRYIELKLEYYNERLMIETIILEGMALTECEPMLELLTCDIKLRIFLPLHRRAYQIYNKLLQLNITDARYVPYMAKCDNYKLYEALYVNFNCSVIEIIVETECIEEHLSILPNLIIGVHNGNIRRFAVLQNIQANCLMETRSALVKLGFSELYDKDDFLELTDDIDCEFNLEIKNNSIDFVWCWKDPHYDYVRFNYDYDDLTL